MEIQTVLAAISGLIVSISIGVYALRLRSQKKTLEDRLEPIINMDKELAELLKSKGTLLQSIDELRKSYLDKKAIYVRLVHEASIYDETVQLAELGFYKPHYDFDTSEKYKTALEKIRAQQKAMISAESAITCSTSWEVSGSKTEGKKMTNRAIRLTARAFNNECEAAISNTRWNNAERMDLRIRKTYEAINKLNESQTIVISAAYLQLKLDEFRLAYEYQDKKQKEKEEQAAIRLQMKEDAKLEQEAEAAFKEEDRYQRLLEKAQKDAEKASGEKLSELEEKIAALQADLTAAHEKSERAKSMAQQTKAGHVYVISNVGSFGDHVYKIGMTRRLEPDERVKELGDASVPFTFDVHAMIYSNDAPALENELHKRFQQHRLNLVNQRKEFFKVELEHIEEVVRERFQDAEFTLTAEASEYRESASIRTQKTAGRQTAKDGNTFPAEI